VAVVDLRDVGEGQVGYVTDYAGDLLRLRVGILVRMVWLVEADGREKAGRVPGVDCECGDVVRAMVERFDDPPEGAGGAGIVLAVGLTGEGGDCDCAKVREGRERAG